MSSGRHGLPRRYQVLGTLGEGAFGEVFHVRDRLLERDLALKRFKIENLPEGALEILRQEFLLLTRLHHPGIPQVHEVSVAGRAPFFTMDLLRGPNLFDGIRGEAMGPLPADRMQGAVNAFLEVLSTLRYIHARGVIHGDLKPSNVLYRHAPRRGRGAQKNTGLALVDFGLHLPRRRGAGLSGTLDYLAPEQLSSGSRDSATDLFALGVLFHEVLAGTRPWAGQDPLARMQGQGALPPDLSDSVPGLLSGLADLVGRLLAPDRALRYHTAEEAQRDLLLIGGYEEEEAGAILRRDFQFNAGLVGREEDLAHLRHEAVAAAASGRGSLTALVAANGLGGTRLLRQLRQEIQAAGGQVIRCDLGRGSIEAALEVIIARLGGDSDAISKEERRLRSQLDQALAEFQLAGDGTEDVSARRQEVFERLMRWARAVLERRAGGDGDRERKEVVWILEDLHAADSVTQECVRHLAANASLFPALTVLTGEPGEWLEDIDHEHRRVLEELTREQVERVLRESFAELEEGASLASAVQERVHGNLLLLELLVVELVRNGGLRPAARGWVAEPGAVQSCPLPETAHDVREAEVEALGAREKAALSVAAFCGSPFTAARVAGVLERELAEVVLVLEALVSFDLIEPLAARGETLRYRFRHAWLAELLPRRLPATRLRKLRRLAAQHLRQELIEGDETAREPLARLCAALREYEEAANLHQELARSVRIRLDPEAAYAHLVRAAGFRRRAKLPITDELLGSIEHLAFILGRYEEARDALRKLLRRSGSEARERAEILVRLGRVEQILGEHSSARRRLESALRLAPPEELGLAGIEANRILAKVARIEGDYDKAEQLYDAAAEIATSHSTHALIRVLTSQGEFYLRRADLERAETVFRRCLELARGRRERPLLASIHVGLGQLLMDRRPTESVESFETAVELAQEHAQVSIEAGAHYNLGIVSTDLALLDKARDSYLKAQSLLGRKQGIMHARLEAQLGNLARERGDFRQAEEHYRRFEEKGVDLPPGSPIRLLNRVNQALLALARGDAESALASLRQGEADFLPGYPRAFMAYQRTRARLELEAGDRDEALRRATLVAELAAKREDPYFRIAAAMLQGDLAKNGPDPAGGREKLLAARALARQIGNRKLEAETSLLLAELQVERPELGSDPRAPLAEAREILAKAGMRPALERVARVTKRLEGTPEWVAAHRPARTAKELSTLYRASEAIRTRKSLDELFEKLLDTAMELMGAERGFIFLTRKGSRRLDACASRGGDPAVERDAGTISRNILKATVRDVRPIFSSNAMTDERFRDNQSVLDYGIRSFICAPILLPERVLGTLYVDHRKLDSLFVQSDADFLMAYANFAAAAIENAIVQGDLTKQVRHLRREARERWDREPMVGMSPAMSEIRDLIERIGPTDSSALVLGESGTGKELVARALHESSPRADGPFVAVNCAALPEALVESELFGAVRGAATDIEERAGKFEEAQGGTLFLDEIGDLAPSAQAKILRAIESRRIQRLGSNLTVELDFRLVTATHSDLEAAMREGRFRKDLYYRLNVVSIELPPLRERREDVSVLLRHFVDAFCQEQSKPTLEIDTDVLASYLDYDWPGNIRELRNAVERAVLLTRDSRLLVFAPPTARERGGTDLAEAFQLGHDEGQVKRAYARLVYQRLEGNKRRTCQILGIDYKTLQNRLSSDA